MEAEGWRMGEYNEEGVEGIWEQQGEVVEEKGTEGRGGRGDGNRGEVVEGMGTEGRGGRGDWNRGRW